MEKVSAAAVPFVILDLFNLMHEGWNISPQMWSRISLRIVTHQSDDPQQAARNTIKMIFEKFPHETESRNITSIDMNREYFLGLAFSLGCLYGVPDVTHGEWIITKHLQNTYVLHPGFADLTQKLASRDPSDSEVLLLGMRFCEPNNRTKDDESTGENVGALIEFVQRYGSRETVCAVMQKLMETEPLTHLH